MDRWIEKEIVKNLELYYERPPSIKLDDNPVSSPGLIMYPILNLNPLQILNYLQYFCPHLNLGFFLT